MSKGLKTTIALSSALVACMAVSTGVRAQTAGENEDAPAPAAEWVMKPEGMRPVFSLPREPGRHYSQTVDEHNQELSAVGSMNAAAPKNRKVRSEE